MFGRKVKTSPEPLRDRRARAGGQPVNPAFSYYTNRPEPTRMHAEQRGADLLAAEKRPRPRLWGQLPLVVLLLIALVCVGKMLLLGTDPKIIVLGKSEVAASYLKPSETYRAAAQKILASSLTSHTKLTVNLDGTAAALQRQYPELQAVSVTLPLMGSRPIVYAQVAQPSVVLQSAQGNFAINKAGLVLSKTASVPVGVPILVDQSGATPKPGRQYLPGTTVSFIQTMAYQFAAAKIAVSAYVLPSGSPYELDVRLEGRPYMIRSSLVSDALLQSGAAIATIQHLGGTVPSSYVDVRVPGRAYYK